MSIAEFVKGALEEDVGRGDLYSRVSPSVDAVGKIIAKCDATLAGVRYADALAELEKFEIEWEFCDGDNFRSGDVLAKISTDSHTLLRCERTILNIILHASSIATLTREYVVKLEPYRSVLLDTRKTRPHLREFEKYATRVGGALNHRMGLDDMLMLKDTHLRTIKNLKKFIADARSSIPFSAKIEVEVESLAGAKEAFEAGADIVMCDNMSLDEIVDVVAERDRLYPNILIEASGNVTLESIEKYAGCGVDAISCGSLIHQANWIDISMKFD